MVTQYNRIRKTKLTRVKKRIIVVPQDFEETESDRLDEDNEKEEENEEEKKKRKQSKTKKKKKKKKHSSKKKDSKEIKQKSN